MRASEFITESRGLYARTPNDPPFTAVEGNPFGVPAGAQFNFSYIKNFPETGGYNSPEELADAVKKITAKLKNITWINPPGRNRAFGIAEFASVDNPNTKIYFGKYFSEIGPSMFGKWGNSEVPGLQPELGGSKKARAGLKPQEILGERPTFKNGQDLMNHIQSLPSLDPSIKQGLLMFSKKQLPVFVGQAQNLTAIRDNLGEIMQALACTYGMVGGEAEQARKAVLGGKPWNTMGIHFPPGQTYGLVDFYLRSGNFSIGVSSKGGKGASASVRNLADGLRAAKAAGQDLAKDYPFAAEVINLINNTSMVDGPLQLGIELGFVDQHQADVIRSMIKTRATKMPKGEEAWIKELTSQMAIKQAPGWNYGHWCLAVVAKMVAGEVNANPNFSEGAVAFLNYSSMMQLYTDATVQKNDVHVTGFRAVYPPNFQGTIELDAGKAYYATDVKQRFTFKFVPK